MIKKRFFENVLDTLLIVCVGNTDNTKSEENVYGEYIDEDRSIIINIDNIKTKVLFMKTLSHELLHFVGFNLRRKGIDHTAITEEIYCYMYDFYFGKIWEWIENEKVMKNLK